MGSSETEHGFIPLRSSADIVRCRQRVRQLAEALRVSLVGQTKIATAASELARNALVYGGGEEMRWRTTGEAGAPA